MKLNSSELNKRYRASARVALYGSLLITVTVGTLLGLVAEKILNRTQVDLSQIADWARVDWGALPEVQLLQRYLQVDTNVEDGSEVAGAEFLAQYLEEAGIPYELKRLSDRHANLWAILEGEDPEAIVLHGHIDVEPIRRPEAWRFPPFSGTINGPWIYGRGAFDMKSVTAAQLFALLDLKRSGVPLRKSVIFLATGSEERGSDLGTRWVLRNQPDLVQRFGVVITEGGLVEAIDERKAKYWGIEVGQRRFIDVLVCHPQEQALLDLRRELQVQSGENLQLVLIPEIADFLRSYSNTRTREDLQELLRHPEKVARTPVGFHDMPRYLKSMFRNETAPFPVMPMPGGGGYQMIVKVHLLPGEELQPVRELLMPDWMLHGFDWQILDPDTAPRGSPLDHPAYLAMKAVLEEHHPEVPVGPFILPTTATDSRFFRREGIPSYGFSPFFILTPDTLTGANPNERIALPGYVQGVETYVELLRRLAAAPAVKGDGK